MSRSDQLPREVDLYDDWLRPVASSVPSKGTAVEVFKEDVGTRSDALSTLRAALVRHYKGLDAVARLGFEEAAKQARVKMPTVKQTRSGELGEILAAEYVAQKTDYFLPITKLQRRDSRDQPLRGADIFALRRENRLPRVLKGESKSRAKMAPAVVQKAVDGLNANAGRPSPFDWSFIADYLWAIKEDDLARFVEDCQTSSTTDGHFEHLVFAFAGNNPGPALASIGGAPATIRRRCVGVEVDGHQGLVEQAYNIV